MANKFFEPGDQRATQVQTLFSTIASRYDFINDLQSLGLHRYWKRRLGHLAEVKAQERVLDLCCGTGDLALPFSQAGADVTGVDFNGPMLAMARQRLAKQARPVQLIRADALDLPFQNDQFDVVTVSYGLRNLADLDRGFEQMWRVTKPGGRLLVLDFGKPPNRLLRILYFAYLRHWVPLFGRLFCGDSATYAYILESLENYPAQDGITALMQRFGCESIRVFNLLGGMMSIHYGRKERRAPEGGGGMEAK